MTYQSLYSDSYGTAAGYSDAYSDTYGTDTGGPGVYSDQYGDTYGGSIRTIQRLEIGLLYRHQGNDVLTLVWGPRRSRPVGYSDANTWDLVSDKFVFDPSLEGRELVMSVTSVAWIANKAAAASVLRGALNDALNDAGYRKLSGGTLGTDDAAAVT